NDFHFCFTPFLMVFTALLLVLSTWRWLRSWELVAGPPGPLPWPILGNALQLGASPHLAFLRLARRYGPVFALKLGSRNVVVLSGSKIIQQTLLKQGSDFAARPDFPSFQMISRGKSMAFGTYGPLWKLHRRVAQSVVREFSTKNVDTRHMFEKHVVAEVGQLIQILLGSCERETFIEPTRNIIIAVGNIMSAVCFGTRYDHSDKEFQQLLSHNDRFGKTVGAGSLVDVMPWLLRFPNPVRTGFREFRNLNEEFSAFIQTKVAQHRNTHKTNMTRDMTDSFIDVIDSGRARTNGGISLTPEFVESSMTDVFGASQDTLSTALMWIFLLLVHYPEVQRKVHAEIDRVVGRDRLPLLSDEPRLVYTVAFIFEVMRFSSFIPVTIPHAASTDTSIRGFRVPKGTIVFVNQYSVNHDPEIWQQPDRFDPTRFLTPAGDTIDKDLVNNILIFSLGKRRCIGEALSKMQLFILTSVLLGEDTSFTPRGFKQGRA
uniref:Cytochrome P450, family 1, subfamily B, polypeptide 1 n=1 Tax=Eptatretus burgeri TaxID=7764 RepID=A0A8C4WUR2_EPTBU